MEKFALALAAIAWALVGTAFVFDSICEIALVPYGFPDLPVWASGLVGWAVSGAVFQIRDDAEIEELVGALLARPFEWALVWVVVWTCSEVFGT